MSEPKPKKIKIDEYQVSESERRARAAWRVSPSTKMVQKHSVYAVILRTITWLEGLHSQAIIKATEDQQVFILKLEFKVCSNDQSLYRKLLIQMGDPNGSTTNRSPAQNPEKTFNNFLKFEFDSNEKFIVKNFTPYAAHTLIQRYCRYVYDSYSSRDSVYIENTHPIEHPGFKDLFRFLPPEIDVCSFVNLKFSDMERTAQRSQIPKFNVSEMDLEDYDPLPPISIHSMAKSTISRESAKITDKKRCLKKSGDYENAEKLNILQSDITLQMLIRHQTKNGCVFPDTILFPIYETQTIPGYDLPVNGMVMSILAKISLGGPALFADTLNASMEVDSSLDSLGIQFLSRGFLDKSASIYKFRFERSETSVVGSHDWDKLDFQKQAEMSLDDISQKKMKMLVVSDYNKPVYAVMLILYYHRQVAKIYELDSLYGPTRLARRLGYLLMEMYLLSDEFPHLWRFVLTYCATWQSLIRAGDQLVKCESTEELHTFCNMIFYRHSAENIKFDRAEIMERYCVIFKATDDIENIKRFFKNNKDLIGDGEKSIERYFTYWNDNHEQTMYQQLLGKDSYVLIPYSTQDIDVEVDFENDPASNEFFEINLDDTLNYLEKDTEPQTPSSISLSHKKANVELSRELIDQMEQGSSSGPNASKRIQQNEKSSSDRTTENANDLETDRQEHETISFHDVKLPSVRGYKKEVMELYDRQVEMNETFDQQFERRDQDVCTLKCQNRVDKDDYHKSSPSKICEYCLRLIYRSCDEYLWLSHRFDKCYDCVCSFTMKKATTKRNWATYMKIRKKTYISPTTYIRVLQQVDEKGLKSLQFKKPKASKSKSSEPPPSTVPASMAPMLEPQENQVVQQQDDGDFANVAADQ